MSGKSGSKLPSLAEGLNKEQAELQNRQFTHCGLGITGINQTTYFIDLGNGEKDILDVLIDGTKYLEKIRVENGNKVFYPAIEVTNESAYSSYTYKG